MTTRKPLVPWNRDPGRGTGKATKKERYRFALLSRASLVEQLNMILRQVDVSGPPVTLSEEDLTNPTVGRGEEMNEIGYTTVGREQLLSSAVQTLVVHYNTFTRSLDTLEM